MYSHSTINILRHTQTEKHIHICARISKHTHTRTRTRSYPDTDTQSNVKCKQKFHDSPQLLLQPAAPHLPRLHFHNAPLCAHSTVYLHAVYKYEFYVIYTNVASSPAAYISRIHSLLPCSSFHLALNAHECVCVCILQTLSFA